MQQNPVLVDEVGPNRPNGTQKRKFTGRHTDWERVNKAKQKTGALGEEIVLDFLIQQAEKKRTKQNFLNMFLKLKEMVMAMIFVHLTNQVMKSILK
ncbi:hypothetical protein [Staphylococcus sp.]|uniref:hypothetical protein n=1 Tax=Staphylococcus sp. TaxID=29387 RepID=UPI002909CAB5|nr:hypothetical protein [Staphylococcus sp.]MDU4837175.1 hypothetical protein [Staphylococcus sp.]